MLIEIEPEILSNIVDAIWECYSNGLASEKLLEWATTVIFANEWGHMYWMPKTWFPDLYDFIYLSK